MTRAGSWGLESEGRNKKHSAREISPIVVCRRGIRLAISDNAKCVRNQNKRPLENVFLIRIGCLNLVYVMYFALYFTYLVTFDVYFTYFIKIEVTGDSRVGSRHGLFSGLIL